MKKIIIALLIFLVSLGALSLLSKSGGNTPHYSAESVQSPFIEDPVLEENINKVTITHYVQEGDKEGVPYIRFVVLLSNVKKVSIASPIEFEVMNNETGQIYHENVNSIRTNINIGNQEVTAESMGGDYFALIDMQKPQNGEYTVTCSVSYLNSKTKTTASRVYTCSDTGVV